MAESKDGRKVGRMVSGVAGQALRENKEQGWAVQEAGGRRLGAEAGREEAELGGVEQIFEECGDGALYIYTMWVWVWVWVRVWLCLWVWVGVLYICILIQLENTF